jgi:hypothetical protein
VPAVKRDGVLAQRLAAQLLAGPRASDPVAVARRLVAVGDVQAQQGSARRL